MGPCMPWRRLPTCRAVEVLGPGRCAYSDSHPLVDKPPPPSTDPAGAAPGRRSGCTLLSPEHACLPHIHTPECGTLPAQRLGSAPALGTAAGLLHAVRPG